MHTACNTIGRAAPGHAAHRPRHQQRLLHAAPASSLHARFSSSVDAVAAAAAAGALSCCSTSSGAVSSCKAACIRRWSSSPRQQRHPQQPCPPSQRQQRRHLASQRRQATCRAGTDDDLPFPADGGGQPADGNDKAPSPLQTSFEAAQQIWALVDQRELDALLDFVPDEVLDAAIQERKAAGVAARDQSLTLQDIVELGGRPGAQVQGFSLDSFAQRHMLLSRPRALRLQSSFLVAPDKAVHRYGVIGATGEACVLTLYLSLQETLQPQYRSARICHLWRLTAAKGEPEPDAMGDGDYEDGDASGKDGEGGAAPRGPRLLQLRPQAPPEAVVQGQLDALRCSDVSSVFAYASPANQAMTGPLERFGAMLRSPMFRPLLGHSRASSLKRHMVDDRTYIEVVLVSSPNTGLDKSVELVYCWEVGRQPPGSGEFANCWMVNGVQLLSRGPQQA